MNGKRIGIISGAAIGLAAIGYGAYRFMKARNLSRKLTSRESDVEM